MSSKSQILSLKLFLRSDIPIPIKNKIIYDFQNTPIWFSPELNATWEESTVEEIVVNDQTHWTLLLKTHLLPAVNTIPIIAVLSKRIMDLQMMYGDGIQLFHLAQVAGCLVEYLKNWTDQHPTCNISDEDSHRFSASPSVEIFESF